MDDATRRYIAKLTAGSSNYNAQLGLQGTLGAAQYGYNRELLQQDNLNQKALVSLIGFGGPLHREAEAAQKAGTFSKWYRDTLSGMRTSGGGGGGFGAPPPGAVERVGQ